MLLFASLFSSPLFSLSFSLYLYPSGTAPYLAFRSLSLPYFVSLSTSSFCLSLSIFLAVTQTAMSIPTDVNLEQLLGKVINDIFAHGQQTAKPNSERDCIHGCHYLPIFPGRARHIAFLLGVYSKCLLCK